MADYLILSSDFEHFHKEKQPTLVEHVFISICFTIQTESLTL